MTDPHTAWKEMWILPFLAEGVVVGVVTSRAGSIWRLLVWMLRKLTDRKGRC